MQAIPEQICQQRRGTLGTVFSSIRVTAFFHVEYFTPPVYYTHLLQMTNLQYNKRSFRGEHQLSENMHFPVVNFCYIAAPSSRRLLNTQVKGIETGSVDSSQILLVQHTHFCVWDSKFRHYPRGSKPVEDCTCDFSSDTREKADEDTALWQASMENPEKAQHTASDLQKLELYSFLHL